MHAVQQQQFPRAAGCDQLTQLPVLAVETAHEADLDEAACRVLLLEFARMRQEDAESVGQAASRAEDRQARLKRGQQDLLVELTGSGDHDRVGRARVQRVLDAGEWRRPRGLPGCPRRRRRWPASGSTIAEDW